MKSLRSAVSGMNAAEPTIPLMKSRRRKPPSRSAPTIAYSDAITAGIYDRRNGGRPSFCVATILRTDVRYGSKADIAALPINVRFTPKSRHRNWPHYESAQHQVRQLRHVGRDPPRFIFGEQLGHRIVDQPVQRGADCCVQVGIGEARSRTRAAIRSTKVMRFSAGRALAVVITVAS